MDFIAGLNKGLDLADALARFRVIFYGLELVVLHDLGIVAQAALEQGVFHLLVRHFTRLRESSRKCRVALVPLLALVQVFAEGRVGDMEVGSNLLCRGPVFGPFDDLVQVGEDMGLVFTFCHSLPPAFLKNWLLFHRSKGSFFFRPEGGMFFHSGFHACVGDPLTLTIPPIPPFLSLSPWSGGDHFRGLTKMIRDPRP